MADALSRAPVEQPSKDDEIFIEETEEFKNSVAHVTVYELGSVYCA